MAKIVDRVVDDEKERNACCDQAEYILKITKQFHSGWVR